MKKRKENINEDDQLLAGIHTLTLPSPLKTERSIGSAAVNKVNEHFFYYGKYTEKSYDLFLKKEDSSGLKTKISPRFVNFSSSDDELRVNSQTSEYIKSKFVISREDAPHKDECYFAPVYEDFLLNYSVWNFWLIERTDLRTTLATLYVNYLDEKGNFPVISDQVVRDSFSLELLAHWSITSASHAGRIGKSNGKLILKEFIENIQYFPTDKPKQFSPYYYDIPEKLRNFLRRITVPYLICGPPKKRFIDNSEVGLEPDTKSGSFKAQEDKEEGTRIEKLIRDLAPFVQLGTCYRPKNSAGWDVLFDMNFDKISTTGYIECKLWSTSIGIIQFYPHYLKACKAHSKLSFMVVSKIQSSLMKMSQFPELIPGESKPRDLEAESKEKNKIPAKRSASGRKKEIQKPEEQEEDRKQKIYKEIYQLWTLPQNRINIYAIGFKTIYDKNVAKNIGKFDFRVLKEHEDPQGVFLLVESNFSPIDRSVES